MRGKRAVPVRRARVAPSLRVWPSSVRGAPDRPARFDAEPVKLGIAWPSIALPPLDLSRPLPADRSFTGGPSCFRPLCLFTAYRARRRLEENRARPARFSPGGPIEKDTWPSLARCGRVCPPMGRVKSYFARRSERSDDGRHEKHCHKSRVSEDWRARETRLQRPEPSVRRALHDMQRTRLDS